MKFISLDGLKWSSPDDFYSALLPELGAPAWHGHNLDALDDSLFGGVNQLVPPFRVTVCNTGNLSAGMTEFLEQVAKVFADAGRHHGVDISFELI